MTWGDYRPLHRGAFSGTTDPEGWELYTGGQWPTWRQIMKPHEVNGADRAAAAYVYRRVPALGQAPSALPELAGVPSNDRTHIRALDGHLDSAISSHQDGRFAQNTAATQDHSLGANYATFMGAFPAGGLRPVALPNYTVDVEGNVDQSYEGRGTVTRVWDRDQGGIEGYIAPVDPTATASQLSEGRIGTTKSAHDRFNSREPELLVKAATWYGSRMSSVLEREWSAPELGLGALGVYMAYSALA